MLLLVERLNEGGEAGRGETNASHSDEATTMDEVGQ